MALTDVNKTDVNKGNIPAVLGTPDHRYLGRLFMAVALIFGIFAFVGAVLLSLAQRDISIFESADRHQAFFSTYRVSLIFLFLAPLLLGLAFYIVPRQIGAKSLVFGRAALGAFWGWLAGACMFLTAWAIDGGFAPGGDQQAVELSLLSFGLVVVSLLAAMLVLVATIIVSRIQNMTLWQVPVFSWSMLVTGAVWLVSLPVLLSNIVTAWIDLRGQSAVHYGLAQNLYSQIDWIFDQPQVFIFALPILGIFTDILISAKGERMRHYEAVQILIALFGILSFGAYAQEFFYADVTETPVFVMGALLMLLVLVVLIGGWLNYARRHKLTVPIVIGTFAILALVLAAAISAVRVMGDFLHFFSNFGTDNESYQDGLQDFLNPLLDLKQSAIANSVLHLVAAAGFTGALAGAYYWAPKIFNKRPSPVVGIATGFLAFAGASVWALGDLINGFLELPELPLAVANFEITDSIKLAAVLAIVGSIGVFLALTGVVAEILKLEAGDNAGDNVGDNAEDKESMAIDQNPWNAPTLEWADEETAPQTTASAYPLWSNTK